MTWISWREWMVESGYMTMEDIPLLSERANCKRAFLKAPPDVWLEPKDRYTDEEGS